MPETNLEICYCTTCHKTHDASRACKQTAKTYYDMPVRSAIPTSTAHIVQPTMPDKTAKPRAKRTIDGDNCASAKPTISNLEREKEQRRRGRETSSAQSARAARPSGSEGAGRPERQPRSMSEAAVDHRAQVMERLQILQGCAAWAHNVSLGRNKTSQKKNKQPFMLDNKTGLEKAQRYLMAAAKGKGTKGSLPELDSDERWAVADAGSIVTGADCAKEFPGVKIENSKAQQAGVEYTAANGGKIGNNGKARIVHLLPDGGEVKFIFQNVKTALPIISIRKLAGKGAVATFWKGGGEILLLSGSILPVYEGLGVYFVKLKIQGMDDQQQRGFHRRECH